MTTIKLAKGLNWSALPKARIIFAVQQDEAIVAFHELASDWVNDGEDLAQIEVNLPLILADVCRIVLHLNEEQIQNALGAEMYAAVHNLEGSR